ncbi:MAG: hypothetical protein KAH68_05590, partial [Draconibacterium sp.]|nr:hypothetical protein [Draconibacterium sp.]
MNKKETILYLILATFVFISCGKQNTDIFVSPMGNNNNDGTKEMPLETIEKAFEIVETIRESKNITISIHLLEGDYHLSNPLLITARLNNISIIGESVDKVSIKGSTILNTNWKAFNENVWVTDVENEIDFNQLFINGEKQILARYPNFDKNGGFWQGHAEDAIAKERIATWKNQEGGYVHAMHKGQWGGFHYQITGIDINGELTLIG